MLLVSEQKIQPSFEYFIATAIESFKFFPNFSKDETVKLGKIHPNTHWLSNPCRVIFFGITIFNKRWTKQNFLTKFKKKYNLSLEKTTNPNFFYRVDVLSNEVKARQARNLSQARKSEALMLIYTGYATYVGNRLQILHRRFASNPSGLLHWSSWYMNKILG